jgi:hypothetical protein
MAAPSVSRWPAFPVCCMARMSSAYRSGSAAAACTGTLWTRTFPSLPARRPGRSERSGQDICRLVLRPRNSVIAGRDRRSPDRLDRGRPRPRMSTSNHRIIRSKHKVSDRVTSFLEICGIPPVPQKARKGRATRRGLPETGRFLVPIRLSRGDRVSSRHMEAATYES